MAPNRRRKKVTGYLPEDRLSDPQIARRMFLVGCLALPVIWAVAVVRYRKVLCGHADADDELRTWVRRSALGLGLAVAAFVSWTVVYQTKWKEWHLEYLMVT